MFLELAPKEGDLHCFSLPTASQAKLDDCTKLLEVGRPWVRDTWLYLCDTPATEVLFLPGPAMIDIISPEMVSSRGNSREQDFSNT